MTPENKKILWSRILEAGDFLKDKLPPHPSHPKGRNSYAHVALEIKNQFGDNIYENNILDSYLRGQLIVGSLLSLFYFLSFYILDLNYSLFIGLFTRYLIKSTK